MGKELRFLNQNWIDIAETPLEKAAWMIQEVERFYVSFEPYEKLPRGEPRPYPSSRCFKIARCILALAKDVDSH